MDETNCSVRFWRGACKLKRVSNGPRFVVHPSFYLEAGEILGSVTLNGTNLSAKIDHQKCRSSKKPTYATKTARKSREDATMLFSVNACFHQSWISSNPSMTSFPLHQFQSFHVYIIYIYIPAPSKGWCLNPKGLLSGTPYRTIHLAPLGGSRYTILYIYIYISNFLGGGVYLPYDSNLISWHTPGTFSTFPPIHPSSHLASFLRIPSSFETA